MLRSSHLLCSFVVAYEVYYSIPALRHFLSSCFGVFLTGGSDTDLLSLS
jgi:hypothetical protein